MKKIEADTMSNSTRESLAARVKKLGDSMPSRIHASEAWHEARIAFHAAIDALAAAAAPVAQGEAVAWIEPGMLPFGGQWMAHGNHPRFTMPLYAAPASPAAGAERPVTDAEMPSYGSVPWSQLVDAVSLAQVGRTGHFAVSEDIGHAPVSMNMNSLNRIVSMFVARAAIAPPVDAPAQQQQQFGCMQGEDCRMCGHPCSLFSKPRKRVSPPSAVQAAQQVDGATGDTLFRTFMAEAEKAGITHWPAPVAQQVAAERVYLVATGETHEGRETFTRHETCPPLCDAETLFTTPAREHVEALSEAEIEDCIDAALAKYRQHQSSGPRGQQVTTRDDWRHWLAREIESRLTQPKGRV